MAKWGLNTYMYGPKDDEKHRAAWKQAYSKREGGKNLQISSNKNICWNQDVKNDWVTYF